MIRPRLRGWPPGVGRLVTGTAIMIGALGLQLAMVVDVVAPRVWLGLGGYAALFAGMIVALTGVLARHRER